VAFPFKLNPFWLGVKGFTKVVQEVWNSLEFDEEPSALRRLVQKLKVLKHKAISWGKTQKKLRLLEVSSIEEALEKYYLDKANGSTGAEVDVQIKELEYI